MQSPCQNYMYIWDLAYDNFRKNLELAYMHCAQLLGCQPIKDIWVWSILWQLALPEFCNIHEIALKQINMYLAFPYRTVKYSETFLIKNVLQFVLETAHQ